MSTPGDKDLTDVVVMTTLSVTVVFGKITLSFARSSSCLPSSIKPLEQEVNELSVV
jgi:hypothetical protein